MELTWIEDFLTLCRTQNFTEAAVQRCTTQPAFGRRILNLESWLGIQLFDRATRPVRLTAGGEDFLRRAERIREDMLDARRIAQSSQSHYKQAVRIYTTTAIAVGIVPKWLKEAGALNHSILTSSTGGSLEALRQKRADQILLPWFVGDVEDKQLSYRKIASDKLVLVEHCRAEERVSYRNKTLAGPMLMHVPGSVFGQQIARHLAALRIECDRHIICESSSAETLLALVKRGVGAAWIPESLTDREVARCKVPDTMDVPCDIMLIERQDKW